MVTTCMQVVETVGLIMGYLCGWLYAKLVFFFLTKSEVICQKQGDFGMRFSSRWSVFV